jgi:hypothetical protein
MTHIVCITGTSGAGKSTVMRRLIEAGKPGPTIMNGPREIGHIIYLGEQPTFVAGRYGLKDTAGCDTIKDVALWYETILEQSKIQNVVYEGLFVMNHDRGLNLMRHLEAGTTMHVINLTTPWETCLLSINERRARQGKDEFTGNIENIKGHIVRARNFASKLKQLGAQVYHLDRDTAVVKLKELVG